MKELSSLETISDPLYIARGHYNAGRLPEAERICREILEGEPENNQALHLLGAIACKAGYLKEGIDCYRRAIACNPNFAEAHKDLGLSLLMAGEFSEGFAEYEWRWQCPDYTQRSFSVPQWDGSYLEGKTILLHAEPGLSDTLLFIRYVREVRDRGGRVLLECPKPLLRLLSTVEGIELLVPQGEALPEFHVHAPLLSLPHILGTTLETVPAPIPYITPVDSPLKLDAPFGTHLKVGIAWANDSEDEDPQARSQLLPFFFKLLDLPGIALYSLEIGTAAADLKSHQFTNIIQDLSAKVRDFADLAAVVAQLDLVITVDSTVAHLTGAMGQLTWLLLPSASHWCWPIAQESSPWYPTSVFFRHQSADNSLQDLFANVKQALQEWSTQMKELNLAKETFLSDVLFIESDSAALHQPKLVFRSSQVIVYDDFVPETDFRQLFDYAAAANYHNVHNVDWRKVWRLHDGFPLQGNQTLYYRTNGKKTSDNEVIYPSQTPLDSFCTAIFSVLPEVESLVGKSGESWQSFSVNSWLYPCGSGLSLHKDGGGYYSGAYTYFLHPEWKIHWGGYLLVLDPETHVEYSPVTWLKDEYENSQIWNPGMALCILPKPNRIVFINPHTLHMISRVDQNAGQNPRVSLAGFFNIKN